MGKTEDLEKITGSLFVDSSKIRNLLGWKALFRMKLHFLGTNGWYNTKKDNNLINIPMFLADHLDKIIGLAGI